MSWWKKRKCKTCRIILKKSDPAHIIRLNTADGFHELEVCDKCAAFFDKSAEVLSARRGKKRVDLEDNESVHRDDD